MTMATELGGTQVSSLMETLPGIANVLRSPVADALAGVIRAAIRAIDLKTSDVEELMKYATRRGLMVDDEASKLIAEVVAAQQRKVDKAAEREAARDAKAAAKPVVAVAAPKAKAPAPAPAVAKKVVKKVAATAAPVKKKVAEAKPAAKKPTKKR
jgi:hypothetical protein